MFMSEKLSAVSQTQLRVAFDGDAVLFSDESEIIVKKGGLDVFFEHEKKFENTPLAQVFQTLFSYNKILSWMYCERKCESVSVLISIMWFYV
jgi:hypothetical protein